jgi:hypothetical protein
MDFPAGWELKVDQEARKSFHRYNYEGFFDRFLSGSSILDLGYKRDIDAQPIVPQAVGLDVGYPGYDGKQLPFLDGSQDAVFVSHALEHIADYRLTIAEWFRVVRIGGFLVIAVPDQFLYERKRSLPSRWDADHKRFYSPASLLSEIDEALDPYSYRIRYLEENDCDFDYEVPPNKRATGCYEIVIVLERIRCPVYAGELLAATVEPPNPGSYSHLVPAEHGTIQPTMVIQTDSAEIGRIVVLKLDHRGDFILATLALRALRNEFPAADITLICGPWNEKAAQELGIFDRVVPFKFYSEAAIHGLMRTYAQRSGELSNLLAGEAFDLAIDLRVDDDTRELLTVIKARQRAGFGYAERYPFLDIALPFINPTISGRATRFLFKPEQFAARLGGRHDGFAIVFDQTWTDRMLDDIIIHGPYADLEPGQYDIEVLIEPLTEKFEVTYDITANVGEITLAAGTLPVSGEPYPVVSLHATEPLKAVELRLFSGRRGSIHPFRFLGCRVRKAGRFLGPHQLEMQAMLVYLVALRSRVPFRATEIGM